jgi:hypothetical protein
MMECKEKEVAIVGMPRCGTTYLFRSVAGLPPGSGSPKGAALAALPVMKCHSLAPPDHFHDPWHEQLWEHCRNKRKVIWVFGDPIAAVVSTARKRFDHVHAKNCGCYTDLEIVDLFEKDWFNYEKMFDSWTGKKHDYPVLIVRYETMFQNRVVIEKFIGRPIQWNPWNPRSWSPRELLPRFAYQKLTKTYSSLIEKIEAYRDVVWFEKGYEIMAFAGQYGRKEM